MVNSKDNVYRHVGTSTCIYQNNTAQSMYVYVYSPGTILMEFMWLW